MLTGIHIFDRPHVEKAMGSTLNTFQALHDQVVVEGVDLEVVVALEVVVVVEDLLGYHHLYQFPVLSFCSLSLQKHPAQLPEPFLLSPTLVFHLHLMLDSQLVKA